MSSIEGKSYIAFHPTKMLELKLTSFMVEKNGVGDALASDWTLRNDDLPDDVREIIESDDSFHRILPGMDIPELAQVDIRIGMVIAVSSRLVAECFNDHHIGYMPRPEHGEVPNGTHSLVSAHFNGVMPAKTQAAMEKLVTLSSYLSTPLNMDDIRYAPYVRGLSYRHKSIRAGK